MEWETQYRSRITVLHTSVPEILSLFLVAATYRNGFNRFQRGGLLCVIPDKCVGRWGRNVRWPRTDAAPDGESL